MKTRIGYLQSAIAIPAGLIGIFLMIRMKGFCIQAWGLALPTALILAAAAALALAAAVFAPQVLSCLKENIYLSPVLSPVILVASLAISLAGRKALLYKALDSTYMSVSLPATLLSLLGAGLLLGLFSLFLLQALYQCREEFFALCKRFKKSDIFYLLGFLIFLNVISWMYISNSSRIYFWDTAGYWSKAISLSELIPGQLPLLLSTVYSSIMSMDYNYLIAVPSAVFISIFGSSRAVFVASIANCWLFPLFVLIWAAAKARLKHPNRMALLLFCAAPMLLYNEFIGYVDLGGCVPTLLALLLYLSDGNRNSFHRFLLAGLCLAGAVMLRRWYAFFAVAFLLALLLDCLLFRRKAAPVLGAGCGFAFILLFFFQPLVSLKLMEDYSSLYVAYNSGLSTSVLALFRYFGVAILVLCFVIAIAFMVCRQNKNVAFFLLVQPILCFCLFVRVQSHDQQHILLYAPAVICLLLLGLELLELRSRLQMLAALLVGLACTLSPFVTRETITSLELGNLSILPTFSWMPSQNSLAMDIVELVRYLDTFGENGETVGLLASSFSINEDILKFAELSLSISRISSVDRSYLVTLPAVDQRDGWQDYLYDLDILVVASPIQTHLAVENQQVVVIPATQLLEGTGIAAAYEQLDTVMVLGDDITVYFYRRTRELSEEERAQIEALFYEAHPELLDE